MPDIAAVELDWRAMIAHRHAAFTSKVVYHTNRTEFTDTRDGQRYEVEVYPPRLVGGTEAKPVPAQPDTAPVEHDVLTIVFEGIIAETTHDKVARNHGRVEFNDSHTGDRYRIEVRKIADRLVRPVSPPEPEPKPTTDIDESWLDILAPAVKHSTHVGTFNHYSDRIEFHDNRDQRWHVIEVRARDLSPPEPEPKAEPPGVLPRNPAEGWADMIRALSTDGLFVSSPEPAKGEADDGHPVYYSWIPGIKCVDVIKHFDYLCACVIKYVWRAGRKGPALGDYRAARRCLDLKIAELEKEDTP